MIEKENKLINDVILALLFNDKNLSKGEIIIDGFLDVFFDDIERPYLDNHAFILYDTEVVGADYIRLITKLKTIDNLYTEYSIRISGNYYKIFCFTLNPKYKKEFALLKEGKLTQIKEPTKSEILQYNSDNVKDVMNLLSEDINPVSKVLPEQDYVPQME